MRGSGRHTARETCERGWCRCWLVSESGLSPCTAREYGLCDVRHREDHAIRVVLVVMVLADADEL